MPEARALYGFQMAMENIHSETYSLLIEQYSKDPGGKDKLFDAMRAISTVQHKAKWAMQWMNTDNYCAELIVAFAAMDGVLSAAPFGDLLAKETVAHAWAHLFEWARFAR